MKDTTLNTAFRFLIIGAGKQKNLLRNPRDWKLREKLVDSALQYEEATTSEEKNKIVKEIETFVKKKEGRFLQEDPSEMGFWIDVSDEKDLKRKLMQMMRDYSTKRNKLSKGGGKGPIRKRKVSTTSTSGDRTQYNDADYRKLMDENQNLGNQNSTLTNQIKELKQKLARSEQMCISLQKYVIEHLRVCDDVDGRSSTTYLVVPGFEV